MRAIIVLTLLWRARTTQFCVVFLCVKNMANWSVLQSKGNVEDRRDDSKFTYILQRGAKKQIQKNKQILTPSDQYRRKLELANLRRKGFIENGM